MGSGLRSTGEFCWINMLTAQPAEARSFFSKIFQWNFVELPGMGHLIQVSSSAIGGLFDLHGPNTPPGIPPCIGVMVKVDNADVTAEKVVALGGRAKPAFDIADQGRMAVCFDPCHAEFDVWQSKKMQGTAVDSRVHGAPSWFETITSDVERASKFYADLFGWTAETNSMGTWAYTTFKMGMTPVAGLMPILPVMGKIPSHWGTYFTVNNAEQTLKTAVEHGAKVCVEIRHIPQVGSFCGLTSPQGVMFYIIEYHS